MREKCLDEINFMIFFLYKFFKDFLDVWVSIFLCRGFMGLDVFLYFVNFVIFLEKGIVKVELGVGMFWLIICISMYIRELVFFFMMVDKLLFIGKGVLVVVIKFLRFLFLVCFVLLCKIKFCKVVSLEWDCNM